jgi:murein DD-endopeptidase MepM/ murein hydrolase activator NlpD
VTEPYYTLIFVPSARSASRKVRVSARLLRMLAKGAGTMAFVLVGLLAHYAWLNLEMSRLGALRRENEALTEQALRRQRDLGELAGRVSRLQSSVAKLGVMSGLDRSLPAGDPLGGMGGVSGVDADPPSHDPEVTLHALSRSVSDLTERSQKIESFYADQAELLSHTPSVWPVRGYLSSGFGNRSDPFTGGPDYHPGIDAYGLAIIIDHGYGVVTRYGHLERFNVRPGQRVQRGDVIGFVGSTGRSNAPHVHYEVWLDDKAQDPIQYIIAEYRSFS